MGLLYLCLLSEVTQYVIPLLFYLLFVFEGCVHITQPLMLILQLIQLQHNDPRPVRSENIVSSSHCLQLQSALHVIQREVQLF